MSGTRIITFQLNQKRQPALADARVRLAIVNAINNEGIVEKIMKILVRPQPSRVRKVISATTNR